MRLVIDQIEENRASGRNSDALPTKRILSRKKGTQDSIKDMLRQKLEKGQ